MGDRARVGKTGCVFQVYPEAPSVPDVSPLEDPMREQFRQWAIELGLVRPGVLFQDEVEDDDHGEDDDDSEYDVEAPLDGLEDDEIELVEEEVEEEEAPQGEDESATEAENGETGESEVA